MATLLNTPASLDSKTVTVNENADTVTGLKTFERAPSAPFAVEAGSAVVPNLDADKLDGIEGADLVKKDGTVAMTGTLDLGTPGKLKFPAAQSASADANTLDDYEEGSFTPTIISSGGGTPTYNLQMGRYIKIGRLVVVQFGVSLTATGTLAAGSLTIGGLPFTASNTANLFSITAVQWAALNTNWVNVVTVVLPNTTTALVRGANAAGVNNVTALTVADLTATSGFTGTISYFADA